MRRVFKHYWSTLLTSCMAFPTSVAISYVCYLLALIPNPPLVSWGPSMSKYNVKRKSLLHEFQLIISQISSNLHIAPDRITLNSISLEKPELGWRMTILQHWLSCFMRHIYIYIYICVCVCMYIGEGNGNPLQCSCLENPREGRAW